jgi:hypothetical protein
MNFMIFVTSILRDAISFCFYCIQIKYPGDGGILKPHIMKNCAMSCQDFPVKMQIFASSTFMDSSWHQMEKSGKFHDPAASLPRKESSNYCTGSWAVPRLGLDQEYSI